MIHFAGVKAVGESVQEPLFYYKVNFEGTLNLLEVSISLCEGTKEKYESNVQSSFFSFLKDEEAASEMS